MSLQKASWFTPLIPRRNYFKVKRSSWFYQQFVSSSIIVACIFKIIESVTTFSWCYYNFQRVKTHPSQMVLLCEARFQLGIKKGPGSSLSICLCRVSLTPIKCISCSYHTKRVQLNQRVQATKWISLAASIGNDFEFGHF